MKDRPVLFLDIDGTVSPLPATTEVHGSSIFTNYAPELHPDTWADWRNLSLLQMPISDLMLQAIFALPVDIIWCSSWSEASNSSFGKVLQLPPLPYLPLCDSRGWNKGVAVEDWVVDHPYRPIVWADDDPRILRCRKWLANFQPQSLIINPRKAIGLTPQHIEQIQVFCRQIAASSAASL